MTRALMLKVKLATKRTPRCAAVRITPAQVLVLTSLESLGRDETFKSLESLVRLFQKVSKIIIQ